MLQKKTCCALNFGEKQRTFSRFYPYKLLLTTNISECAGLLVNKSSESFKGSNYLKLLNEE